MKRKRDEYKDKIKVLNKLYYLESNEVYSYLPK